MRHLCLARMIGARVRPGQGAVEQASKMGRLDLETLAALRLLPGTRQPFYNPYRQRMRPPSGPPIRGQWEPD